MKDTLNDVLLVALSDKELNGGMREHGSVREGHVLRYYLDVRSDAIKRLRRHVDKDGEGQFPESGEVGPEVEDVVAVEGHSGREEYDFALAHFVE